MEWGKVSISANTAISLTKNIFSSQMIAALEEVNTQKVEFESVGEVETKMMFAKWKKDYNK